MRLVRQQSNGQDVRCLVSSDGKTYVPNCDFQKVIGFNPSYQVGLLTKQEVLTASINNSNFPKDLFVSGNKLKLVSLEGLKKAVESAWQPQEKKDTALDVIKKLEGQEVATNPSVLTFDFGQNQVRVMLDEQGRPWFVAKDVCDTLGIKNIRQNMSDLDENEKGVFNVYTPGGTQRMTEVNESGLYALVFKSRKPEAKQFQKWITSEVLPQIRKTGSYQTPSTGRPEAPIEPIINQLNQFKQEVFDLLNSKEQEVSSLKQEISELKKQVTNPAVIYRTLEQKKQFSVKKGQATQHTNKFKQKIKHLTGIGEGHSYIWGKTWDEINYHITGLDNAQLRMQRNTPESGGGIRDSFTFDELNFLCSLLKHINFRLETYSSIDKESASKVISEICQEHQKE